VSYTLKLVKSDVLCLKSVISVTFRILNSYTYIRNLILFQTGVRNEILLIMNIYSKYSFWTSHGSLPLSLAEIHVLINSKTLELRMQVKQ
jgi:hypothetical protein